MKQRGAALLTAMLTVALVATFASAALWQQWRSVEVEGAERSRVQAEWILTGALDWARLVLREDARAGGDGSDWLGEPWAVPLQEAKLSSFLAADRNTTADSEADVLDAFLSGQVSDMQARMNVMNLVASGRISDADLAAFGRLFDLLGLPQQELERMAENLRFALDTNADNGNGGRASLVPLHVEQLGWLGVSPSTVTALQPYAMIVEGRTAVNVNTASPEVIAAAAGVSLADAQRVVAERGRAHFRTLADARRALGTGTADQAAINVATRYFEVRSRLRLDKLVVEESAVLLRDGTTVTIVRRERGVPPAPAAAADSSR